MLLFIKIESSGKFYHHVKSSKDRRKQKIQSESLQRDVEQEKKANEARNERLKMLEDQLKEFDKLKEEYDDYHEKLAHLYNDGLINSKGEILNNQRQNRDHEEESKSEKTVM